MLRRCFQHIGVDGTGNCNDVQRSGQTDATGIKKIFQLILNLKRKNSSSWVIRHICFSNIFMTVVISVHI